MEKKEILKIIEECAIKYKNNLVNQNLLFVYYNKNKIEYIETKFLASNFLHLTGLTYTRSKNNNAIKFFQDILDKKVSLKNIKIKNEAIVKLKLNILKIILDISYSAKMIGTFDAMSKNLLITDKIVGTNQYSMGFIKIGNYYIPNTVLKEDIRNITEKTNRIIAILNKTIKEKQYTNITFLERKTKLWQIMKNEELKSKINTNKVANKN